MRINKIFPALAFLGAVAAGCTNEDYKLYDTAQKDSVFFEYRNLKNDLDSIYQYSFNYDVARVHTLEIPVTLMGVPKERDRQIRIDVVAEWSDMKAGTHYDIEDNVIRAGEVGGVVKVHLYRDKDPLLTEKEFNLRLAIAENDDLKSVGRSEFQITYSDIRPELRPDWWSLWSPMPEYSFENAQLFFEYFHRYAPEANLTFYNEMVEAYGPYFEKAQAVKGPLAMYDSFLRNYVCLPLFREHPEIGWQSSPEW